MDSSREPLSRARVVDAALTLVERDGAAALSMRHLGDELGYEAMALYHHVPGREALLDALSEHLMAQIAPPRPQTGWRRALAAFAAELRAVTVRHPETFRLIGMRPMTSAPVLSPVEALLGVLVEAGAPPRDALAIYRSVASFARGYALGEVNGFTVDAGTPAARRVLRALPREDFTILRGEVGALAALTPDEGFALGLDALLDGFAARLG